MLQDMQLPLTSLNHTRLVTNSNMLPGHGGCPQTKQCWGFGRTILQLLVLKADKFQNDATVIRILSQDKTVKFIGKK